MKTTLATILLSIFFLQFCTNKQTKKKESEVSEIYHKDYYTLYKENCTMCHELNTNTIGPAVNRFSVESILRYYDGVINQDSMWKRHRKIEITRKDWEGIANQVQPGYPTSNQ